MGIFVRSLAIEEKALGKKHPEVAEVLNSIGLVQKKLVDEERNMISFFNLKEKKGEYSSAMTNFNLALDIVRNSLGISHPKVGFYLSNLADVYRKMGQYVEAQQFYIQALQIVEKALGSNHEEVANILNNMGLVHKKNAR
jgi:tetratricopeptide (TPR) repeat protein